MNSVKYIGMDVHKEAISTAVLNSSGKLVMECVQKTKTTTILQFIHGLRGSLHVTLEEGTCEAWLHDLLKPHVSEVLVNGHVHCFLTASPTRIDPGWTTLALIPRSRSRLPTGEFTNLIASKPKHVANF